MLSSIRAYAALSFTALCLAACSNSSSDRHAETKIPVFDPAVNTWPHEGSDVPRDMDVTYGVLSNGMRYAVQANSRPEQEASVRMTIRAGAKHEPDGVLGAAHFLEHMAFNGTEDVPEGEMVKSLERMGLAFGADTNASTTFSRTDYRLSLPEVDDETVDYAFFLMRQVADKMLIEPEAVDRERGIVKAEQARRQSPRQDEADAYQAFSQPGSLYSQRPVAGTAETLDAITAEDLRTFYESYYRPERTLLVFVGDIDVATIEAKIETVFGDWAVETPDTAEPDMGFVPTEGLLAKVYDDDELTTSITLYRAEDPTAQGDSLSNRRKAFIRSLANNIVRMRFNKKMMEADRPVLGASLSYGTGQYVNAASLSASVKGDDWETAIAVLDTEIRTALEYGFQQAELDEFIANARRGLTDAANYAAKRPSANVLSAINGTFSGGRVLTTPAYNLENFEKVIPTITLKDLEDDFAKMWNKPADRLWLSGPNVDEVTSEELIAAYEEARTVKVTPPATRRKLEFAYQDFGTPGKVISRNHVEDLDIWQLKFDNNVRLNLKQTDFEDKWIRVYVTIGEGWNAFPKKTPGLSALASSLAQGGYEEHQISEFSEIFAGKNIGLNFRVGTERLSFSGSTNADDFADQLKAWTGLVTAPGYRPEWREKFVEGIEASFHTIDSTPGGVISRDLSRIWHNGDKRYGTLSKEEYLDLKLEDVRKVLQPLLAKGAIEIGVVGDFDDYEVIKAVSETFGALKKRNDKFKKYPKAFKSTFPAADHVTLTHTGEANQGAFYMAWPIDETWTIQRKREYTLLSRIMTNRMTDIIREDMALAYSPNAGISLSKLSPGYGYASASIMADPQYFDAFKDAASSIAANLKSGGITQDELDRAVKPVLESLERAERENSAWLGLVTTSQTQPKTLDWRRSRKTAYEGITPAMLDAAAKTLFNPETLHIVEVKAEAK
ncbi:MAG: M16 family metallopeptidase [Maricaulaceae bacterium]